MTTTIDDIKKGGYTTKDSGERQDYSSGMRRDTTKGKPRYDLCYKPMYKRWAELMERGEQKYGERNWEKANSTEELLRFLSSAERHLQQWINVIKSEHKILDYNLVDYENDKEEDHAAAVFFNVSAGEYVNDKIRKG